MVTVNGNTYALKKLELIDSYVLEQNGQPIWLIPDEIANDFNAILAYAAAAASFLQKNPPPKTEDDKKVEILSGTPRDTSNDEEPIWP